MPPVRHRRASATPAAHARSAAYVGVAVVLIGLVAGGPCSVPLEAQSLVDPIVPGGMLSLGLIPNHSTWDSRYGPNGIEPLGADLTANNAASLFPGVTTLQQDLSALTGSPTGFPAILGPVSAHVAKGVDRLDFEARLGVFDWLTLGIMVPMVRARVPIDVAYRPDTLQSNVGMSPAAKGNTGVPTLLTQLDDAATAARSYATSACDAGPGSSTCSSATSLAQRVSAFSSRTQSAYYASPFFPIAGSPAATALTHALASLNQDLSGAGLSPVQAPFVFASNDVDTATFAQLPGNPGAGIQAAPLETVDGLWQVGDVELSAAVRLLHGEVRDSGAAAPRLSWDVAGSGLMRLGTGHPANPNVFFDVGSGDGQTDFEGSLYGALRVGRHIGIRSTAKYGVQRSVVQLRRVTAPGQILAPLSSLQPVQWSPGSYLYLQVSPRWYLTEGFSLTFDYDYYSKGSDTYQALPAAPGATPLDVSVLDSETAMTFERMGFGLTYSSLNGARGAHGVLPAELDARFVQTVGGSGGRTPKVSSFQIALRIFRRMWGGS